MTAETPSVDKHQAGILLRREVQHVEQMLPRLVNVSLSNNEASALVSFCYNVGTGNFQSSTLRMKLNRGDYEGAANEFWKWRRGGGVILAGLVRRREAERELFES